MFLGPEMNASCWAVGSTKEGDDDTWTSGDGSVKRLGGNRVNSKPS